MRYLLLFVLLLFSSLSYSTQQIKDELKMNGSKFDIDEYPLQKHPNYELIVKKVNSRECTGSRRGYQGQWLIQNNKFYLLYLVKNPCMDSEYLNANEILGEEGFLNVATWYTGNVTFRISPVELYRVDGDSGIKYEAVVYTINQGNVTSREIKDIIRSWNDSNKSLKQDK
jgi:hypothetical protein